MQDMITIQQIWSPPGKEFPKVITTPEQNRYHLYADQKELAKYFTVGGEVAVDIFETTNQKNQPISRIQNVLIGDKWVIGKAEVLAPVESQQSPIGVQIGGAPLKPEISGQEHGLWIKELGEWLRAWATEKIPQTPETDAMRLAMRLYYALEMKRVLGITIEKKAP